MHIRRDHKLGKEEARKRVAKVALDLDKRFALKSEWEGDKLRFRGTGVKGRVEVADDSIEFDVELGFALMMMERQIRSTINATLDEHVG